MDRIIEILQKEYERLKYAMKLGKSIGKENAPEYKQLEKELKETDEAIKILLTNADTGEKQCNLPVVMPSAIEQFNCRFHHIQEMVENKGITKDNLISIQMVEQDKQNGDLYKVVHWA